MLTPRHRLFSLFVLLSALPAAAVAPIRVTAPRSPVAPGAAGAPRAGALAPAAASPSSLLAAELGPRFADAAAESAADQALKARVLEEVAAAGADPHADLPVVAQTRRDARARSGRLDGLLKAAEEEGKPFVVDVLWVGAGANSAIAKRAFDRIARGASSLMLEGGDEHHFGTFDAMGAVSRTNTVELPGRSGHPFRGLPVQVADLKKDTEKFSLFKHLGDATVLGHRAAGSNILFGKKVVEVRESGTLLEARTEDGRAYMARVVVLATGFGPPKLVGDPKTLELIEAESRRARSSPDPNDVPAIEAMDHALHRMSLTRRAGGDPAAPYSGRSVLVAGPGDGGKIMLEGLPQDAQIVWLGQPAKDAEEFAAGEKRKERYVPHVAGRYLAGMLTIMGRYLGSARGADGRIESAFKRESGALESIVTDFVRLCFGYVNEAPSMLAGLLAGGAMEELRAALLGVPGWQEESSIVAKKVPGKPVFVIGGASDIRPGAGIDPLEDKARIGGFLDALGARSEQAASAIALALLDARGR